MEDEKPSPRADLWSALVWIVLGLSIAWGGWTMDRLAYLGVTFYTIPGLVPLLLGLSIAFMGAILLLRSMRAGALTPSGAGTPVKLADNWRILTMLPLCLIFVIGLIGQGVEFQISAAIFIAAFVIIFEFEERRAAGQTLRGIAVAVAYGAIAGLAIQYVFEDLFLLRLP